MYVTLCLFYSNFYSINWLIKRANKIIISKQCLTLWMEVTSFVTSSNCLIWETSKIPRSFPWNQLIASTCNVTPLDGVPKSSLNSSSRMRSKSARLMCNSCWWAPVKLLVNKIFPFCWSLTITLNLSRHSSLGTIFSQESKMVWLYLFNDFIWGGPLKQKY